MVRIVEERDASAAECAVREINSGIYCLSAPFLFSALQRIGRDNAQGEQYLTDVVAVAVQEQRPVAHLVAQDPQEVIGINTRIDLAHQEAVLRRRICERLMLAGVTILDPASTVIDSQVTVGQDTIIAPQTHILGASVIGKECRIGQMHCWDSSLGDGVVSHRLASCAVRRFSPNDAAAVSHLSTDIEVSICLWRIFSWHLSPETSPH
jgi:bifunctional UDP-N-acetylglucosamine pyrophosphorylase/glucosamine-1-phosphate N-acetyltransferase